MADTLPQRQMDFAYPGGQYGTPHDTMNELVKVNVMREGWKETVQVSLSRKPVVYVSLDELLQNYAAGKGTRKVLPVEDGAKLPPIMQAIRDEEVTWPASSSTPIIKTEQPLDMGSRTPKKAASPEAGPSQPGDASLQRVDDSSSTDSLSPIGTMKSADLASTDAQMEAEVIVPKADEVESENSKIFQPPDDPMNDGRPPKASPNCISPSFSKQRPRPIQAATLPAPLLSNPSSSSKMPTVATQDDCRAAGVADMFGGTKEVPVVKKVTSTNMLMPKAAGTHRRPRRMKEWMTLSSGWLVSKNKIRDLSVKQCHPDQVQIHPWCLQ